MADLQSEKSLLGAILWYPTAVVEAMPLVRPEDFSLDSHRKISATMFEMAEAGEPIDYVTLGKRLELRGWLTGIGGYAYLSDLAGEKPLRNVASYASAVVAEASRSALRGICASAEAILGDASTTTDRAIELILDGVHKLEANRNKRRARSIGEYAIAAYDELKRISKESGALAGYTTGIFELDQITTGIRPGEIWIVGALPGRGKSAFAIQMAMANAKAGIPTLMFSLEMTGVQNSIRMFSPLSNVRAIRLRDPRSIEESQWLAVSQSVEELMSYPLSVDESSSLTVRELTARARLEIREKKIRLVIVDYLRLVEGPGKELRERVGNVANHLRQLAKEENVAVVALSQLARPRDRNLNSRPTMLEIKESGDVEAHAHTVILIYQPVQNDEFTHEDELIIGKQRNGPLGIVPVLFDERTLTFKPRMVMQ